MPVRRHRRDRSRSRVVTTAGFAEGVRRFIIGLAKKMLVANTVAVAADAIFALPAASSTLGLAWLGVVCYTLQIYFDFSGYSDMAIGLAKLLRHRLPRELQLSLLGPVDHRVLAALAHLAVDLVPRLPVHSAGRQPPRPGADLS